MGVKEFLGLGGSNKGSNCTQDSEGRIKCDVMLKHGNNLLATGSHYGIIQDNQCNFMLDPTSSRILDEDSAEVEKELRRRRRTCMGGGAIN